MKNWWRSKSERVGGAIKGKSILNWQKLVIVLVNLSVFGRKLTFRDLKFLKFHEGIKSKVQFSILIDVEQYPIQY